MKYTRCGRLFRICGHVVRPVVMAAQCLCMRVVTPRRRIAAIILLAAGFFYTIVVITVGSNAMTREDLAEATVVHIKDQLLFMESLYQQRTGELLALQKKYQNKSNFSKMVTRKPTSTSIMLMQKYAGTLTMTGFENLKSLRVPILYHLMPHLLEDDGSIRPAFHLTMGRHFADVVIGVPTVKRDKFSYWMETLKSLVKNLSKEERQTTLIVLFVGETDLEYVAEIASRVEKKFPDEVTSGLIEVLSPAPSFYPAMESLPLTHGDSLKRVKWRSKQNLDTIFLMGYAQAKGTYYLMLEDDVLAKNNFIKEMKDFIASTSISNPNWFFIEFCSLGGIGKLFRSPDLLHFITFVQLFYTSKPIDWLLESYLDEKVCTNNKNNKECGEKKLLIRPRYKKTMFEHIGLYSSLKGKIHIAKVKNGQLQVPKYFPHSNNPELESIRCPIESKMGHSIEGAYKGENYFWGSAPFNGTTIEFIFKKPIVIERFLIRSGNVNYRKDRFYDSIVEVLPKGREYQMVGMFDEFGLAEGTVGLEVGPVTALRIRVMRSSTYWVLISEIEIKVLDDDNR